MNPWLFAPNINTIHGFSTRHGGVSQGNFSSLNLGGHDDYQESIKQNRKLALEQLNIANLQVRTLHQIHGNKVVRAESEESDADALVSNQKGVPIAIGVADCYPVLFYDAVNQVIGAAHAGWRGTVSRIVSNTVNEMLQLGAQKEHIQVAIGQGISCEKFEVGAEVVEQFLSSGFTKACIVGNKIDLIAANIEALNAIGIADSQIWCMNRCSFEADFQILLLCIF